VVECTSAPLNSEIDSVVIGKQQVCAVWQVLLYSRATAEHSGHEAQQLQSGGTATTNWYPESLPKFKQLFTGL